MSSEFKAAAFGLATDKENVEAVVDAMIEAGSEAECESLDTLLHMQAIGERIVAFEMMDAPLGFAFVRGIQFGILLHAWASRKAI